MPEIFGPAWVPCWYGGCGEFWCQIHHEHVFQCPCPPIEEWSRDPYAEGYAAATLAVHASNGELAWYFQPTPGDNWEFLGQGGSEALPFVRDLNEPAEARIDSTTHEGAD